MTTKEARKILRQANYYLRHEREYSVLYVQGLIEGLIKAIEVCGFKVYIDKNGEYAI